jgi:serine/threonine protein kinase
MSPSAGTRLRPYEIFAPLGTGGLGEVYRARETRLDRTVAIRVSKEEFSQRFEREARAVAGLNHSHICQPYDVGPNWRASNGSPTDAFGWYSTDRRTSRIRASDQRVASIRATVGSSPIRRLGSMRTSLVSGTSPVFSPATLQPKQEGAPYQRDDC